MDCESPEHKCDQIFGECRCYADQVCGIRKNGYIIPCKAGCCSGGCPGQCKGVKPRQPYAFGYLYPYKVDKIFIFSISLAILLVILSTYVLHRKRT